MPLGVGGPVVVRDAHGIEKISLGEMLFVLIGLSGKQVGEEIGALIVVQELAPRAMRDRSIENLAPYALRRDRYSRMHHAGEFESGSHRHQVQDGDFADASVDVVLRDFWREVSQFLIKPEKMFVDGNAYENR